MSARKGPAGRHPGGLDLEGLETRPAQVWGGVRLVPLVRQSPIEGLRISRTVYQDALTVVDVTPRTSYISYIPHGFVASWTGDGMPAAAYGTQLAAGEKRPDRRAPRCMRLRFERRMARRIDRNRLRFLPLHLALEGYLALHFGGPEILWEEWTNRAASHGLSPRVEQGYRGDHVEGLDDALRIFEIHPGQCGVLVYTADALATAFVVPHPEDYRQLHATLVQDLYGELIYHYALLSAPVQAFRAELDGTAVHSLADLRAAADRVRQEWARFHETTMAAGLLDPEYTVQDVQRMGEYTLSRFLPPFQRKRENHIGETITDADGRIAYLKTFRLSENQVRRGHLLTRLAANDWSLDATAAELRIPRPQLARRIENAGFGSLLRPEAAHR